jgi:excinuclease ABC subunit C
MAQALLRRYQRVKSGEAKIPDVLLIDGGKGQITQARQVLDELVLNDILLIGVAKGSSRKPGLETLIVGSKERVLPADSDALHLIQHIRDEAHRFAITGHRQRRDKSRKKSTLESISGVGEKRRKELLRYFGGLQGIMAASVEELSKVSGISEKLAEHIYASLHNE